MLYGLWCMLDGSDVTLRLQFSAGFEKFSLGCGGYVDERRGRLAERRVLGRHERHHLLEDLRFRVQGVGFRIQGSGCRVQGAGFMVQCPGFRV